MSLKIISTPIGNPGDITLRAIDSLKAAAVVIGEERRVVSTLLKRLGVEGADIRLLNEHSTDADVEELLAVCQEREVALVSDCGTPGFCDPGARLVAACRAAGVRVSVVPGASSLMCLLALSGTRLDEFLFRGFLPAEREARERALAELDCESRPVILMDTPYRFSKLIAELAALYPTRRALIGADFTQETEEAREATLAELAQAVEGRKAEFVLLLYPQPSGKGVQAQKDRPVSQGARNPNPKPTGDRSGKPWTNKRGGHRRPTKR